MVNWLRGSGPAQNTSLQGAFHITYSNMLLTIYYNTVAFIGESVVSAAICPMCTLKYNKKSILIISISFCLVYNYREMTIFKGKA